MFSPRPLLFSSPSLPLLSNGSKPFANLKKKVKEDFSKELLNCKTKGIKYVDIDFPAIENSFYGNDCLQQKILNEKITWRRIEEIFKGQNIGLFEDKLRAQDIQTGCLDNSCFLAACISLWMNEARIRKLFAYETNNQIVMINKAIQEGIYCIQLWDKGSWRDVIIDDLFPCNSQNIPLVTNQKCSNVWLILIEKAYSKLIGSFLKLENIHPEKVLRNLTGAPTVSVQVNSKIMNPLWQELERAEKNKFIMTGTTKANINEKNGLNPKRMYIILGVYMINYHEESVKLIKLKNPVYDFDWKGEWNYFDSKWEEVSGVDKSRIGYMRAASEGIFFMNYTEFFSYFENIQICYINDDYHNSYIEFKTNEREGKYYQVNLSFKGDYIFTVSQDHEVEEPDQKYAKICLKLRDEKGNLVDEIIGNDRDVCTGCKSGLFMETKELQGLFTIFIRTDLGKNINHSLTLSCYGPNKVQFQEIKEEAVVSREDNGTFLKIIPEEKVEKERIMGDYRNSDDFSFISFENYCTEGNMKSVVDRINLSPGLTYSKLIVGKNKNGEVRKTENRLKMSKSLF